MKFNLCIVTSWFPNKKKPHLAPFVYTFAKDMANLGLDVSVISNKTSDEPYYQGVDGLNIYRINPRFPLIPIQRLISLIKPDIIHVHAPNYFASMALIPAKIARIPTIATVHRAEIDRVNLLLRVIRKLVINQYDVIVAVSEFSKSLAVKAGGNKEKIKVIYNSCNENLFVPNSRILSRQKLDLPHDKKIILFAGNLIKVKGIITLVDAIIDLKDQPDFHTIIVGKGEDENLLMEKIINENLQDRIIVTGWLPPEKLSDFYRASDVFVLPSFIEGHSVAILEAMASGIPVIATEVGGNSETIEDGVNGFLVPVGNHHYLATKILELLRSEVLWNHLSKNAREKFSSKFSKKRQMEEYLNLYKMMSQSRYEV